MRLKLDQNLGPSVANILRGAGHDVSLAREHGLDGAQDPVLIEVCRAEQRCLVTLDLDFSQVFRYPPSRFSGIAVLRLPEPMSLPALQEAARILARALAGREIDGKLWIVSRGRVREYWEQEG